MPLPRGRGVGIRNITDEQRRGHEKEVGVAEGLPLLCDAVPEGARPIWWSDHREFYTPQLETVDSESNSRVVVP